LNCFVDNSYLTLSILHDGSTKLPGKPDGNPLVGDPNMERAGALPVIVAALWWQWAETQKQSQVDKAAPGVNSLTAAAVSGVWCGEVTYS
jgi:hypothetical protein